MQHLDEQPISIIRDQIENNPDPAADAVDNSKGDTKSSSYSSKLYLVILIIAIIVCTVNFALTNQVFTTTVYNPTMKQLASLSLLGQCPCSRLTSPYGNFVTLQIRLHPVCSSDFVTSRWIETIFPGINITLVYKADFRASASALFQILRSFCKLSEENIQSSISNFYTNVIISPELLSKTVLALTMRSIIDQFQAAMPLAFKSQLDLIERMIFGNQWITGLLTETSNSYGITPAAQTEFISYWEIYWGKNRSLCSCQQSYNCVLEATIYNISDGTYFSLIAWDERLRIAAITGFGAGCMPLMTLLLSSLECFFVQTCVDRLLLALPTNRSFSAMQLNATSRFTMDSSLETIVDLMMIDGWYESFSYDKYVESCAPQYCVYSEVKLQTATSVLIEVIAILGGLTVVLKLITRIIFKIIEAGKMKKSKSLRKHPGPVQISLQRRLMDLGVTIAKSLFKLNLFPSRAAGERLVWCQVIFTRIYFNVLVFSIAILVLYTGIDQEERIKVISNPSEMDYHHLAALHSDNPTCPCRNISISYDKFLSMEPIYHPICSSYYVSSDWLAYLFMIYGIYTGKVTDIPANLAVQFQLLLTLCEHAQEVVEQELRLFLQNHFVTSNIISPSIFQLQFRALMDTWITTTVRRFRYEIQLIQAIAEGNKYLNLAFNHRRALRDSTTEVIVVSANYGNCSCAQYDTCRHPFPIGPINTWTGIVYIEFYLEDYFCGCSVLASLLQSSLGCFYNQTCVDLLGIHLGVINAFEAPVRNFTAMEITGQWPDETNETIEAILNRLIVNEWQSHVAFDAYYTACAPALCSIEYRSHRPILVITMTVIGIIGGLSTSTRVVLLIIIRTIETMFETGRIAKPREFLRRLFRFQTKEQIKNRLQIGLLLACLFVFYFVSFCSTRTITAQIKRPSLSTYERLLEERRSEPLQCSCSKLSIHYETFLSITPRFHALCSSSFVTDEWLRHVYETTFPFSQFNHTDFYRTAYGQFQFVASFCRLSQETVMNAIDNLNKSSYINSQLLSAAAMNNQVKILLEMFQKNTPDLFLRKFDMIRELTEGNLFMNMYSSNWKFRNLPSLDVDVTHLSTEPLSYGSCNCAVSSKCTQPSRNMTAGCYPLEAILQTTLHCFYDQQCIDHTENFPALNRSALASSRFPLNATIELLLNDLMVEEYNVNLSYEDYFNQCEVSVCSYSYEGRQKTIDIVTSLIGLYSGLLVITGWITEFIFRAHFQYQRKTIHPTIN